MTGARRQLTMTVLACAAGAGLVLLAVTRTWREQVAVGTLPLPVPPRRTVQTGGDLVPWLPALALAALAGAGALLATRRAARVVVGVLLALCGLGMVLGAGYGLIRDGVTPVWPMLALFGALPVLGAGLVCLVRQGQWPSMGGRYERTDGSSTGRAAKAETPLWEALDRGEDPTDNR